MRKYLALTLLAMEKSFFMGLMWKLIWRFPWNIQAELWKTAFRYSNLELQIEVKAGDTNFRIIVS